VNSQPHVPALIFGPGLPSSGARGIVSVSALGVEAAAGDVSVRASLADVSLREAGFDERGLELSWISQGDRWAVHVLDAEAARGLLSTPELATTPMADALLNRKRRHTAARSLGVILLVALILLPAVLLLLFVLNANRIAGWIAGTIPIEQEVGIGRQAFEGLRAQLNLRDTGAAYEAVSVIGARLTKGSKYRYEFHVADDKAVNAFALPGGVIVVNTGLIDLTARPEELAGVLAHEVQHIELRHSVRGMVKSLGLRGLFAFATGDIGGSLIGEAVVGMTGLKFSRDDESEADRAGLDSLIEADIDPSGMPAFFEKMSKHSGEAPVAFVSSHPSSASREAALRARLSATQKTFTPLGTGPWPPAGASGQTSPSRQMADGKQWTTQNLNVATVPSYCYDDAEVNCLRYGRLYTWEAAQRGCQSLGRGWRLPANEDWQQLAKHYGGLLEEGAEASKATYTALTIGGKSGFDALLSGGRAADGSYARLDAHGLYWTSSETDPGHAWIYNLGKGGQALNRHRGGDKQWAFAVRCIRD
jgi:beta-barrel assembly-enhancing protease